MHRCELYLAAPFFSDGEREFNVRVLRELEPSWQVFYPYRDRVRMAELIRNGVHPSVAARAVWQCDLEWIRRSSAIVAVIDGRVIDEGVCVELGLAAGLGKMAIGVCTDSRSCFQWGANPMITCCLAELCSDVAELSTSVRRLLEHRDLIA
jgi:nucleoside 2-deoxyribosyltransferase